MKTLGEFILEARGVSHAALSKKVDTLFANHSKSTDTHQVVRYVRNAHTGASNHMVGSVKTHSLGYKMQKADKDGRSLSYESHPLRQQVRDLIKKHGGTTFGSSGGEGFIDTTDGHRHHFGEQAGTAYSTIEHSSSKKRVV